MNVSSGITDNSVKRTRGRNPPKHFAPDGVLQLDYHDKIRGATRAAAQQSVVGCWDMFPALGGNWLQYQVRQCVGASTAKVVSAYQYGQSGVPIRYSMNWCYTVNLEELRRMELGGSPTFEELVANKLADIGSEPSAGWKRFRGDPANGKPGVGFAPVANWPDLNVFNTRELDLGGELIAKNYQPLALGQVSISAPSNVELIANMKTALAPFSDGKRGQMIQASIASASAAFDNADGSRVLTAADFNGADYDHSINICGTFSADLLRGVMPSLPSSITDIGVLWNHWQGFGDNTMVPELTAAGVFTGKWIPLPGAILVDGSAMAAMVDICTIGKV